MSLFNVGVAYLEMIERVRVLASEHRHMRNQLIQSRTRETILASKAAQLQRAINAKQAEIDSLMLEYCPEEMSLEQCAEWARHQRSSLPLGETPA